MQMSSLSFLRCSAPLFGVAGHRFLLCISAGCLFCVPLIANNSSMLDVRLKALESDVEASLQQARSTKLGQELLDERLHNIENALEKLRREMSELGAHLQMQPSGKVGPGSGEDTSATWRAQTDRNIANLQQGLQTLAAAMGTRVSSSGKQEATSKNTTYVVKGGDSLEKIAKKQGVSLDALKEANQLKSTKIQVGQKLKIPESK